VGDRVRIISPDGVKTAFGTSPRISAWEVVYVFRAGRPTSTARAYLPLRRGAGILQPRRRGRRDRGARRGDPEAIDALRPALARAAGGDALIWTWQDSLGRVPAGAADGGQRDVRHPVDPVLIATMNIVSGLIMLVKNKGRDIGILRTMGLSEGAVLRVFFICGAAVGVAGTVLASRSAVSSRSTSTRSFRFRELDRGGAASGTRRGAGLHLSSCRPFWNPGDVLSAVSLSLGLSFLVTIFPARRAARMNPVEALRYE
jgi:lipoprotein-releasing system permease protein